MTAVLGLVSYQVFPAKMGGQKCVEGWYSHLAKKVPVTLAVAKQNEMQEGGPFTVLPFLFTHWWGWMNLFYVWKLRRIIKERKITVLVIESSYMGWLGVLLRKITRVPVVIRSHNIEFQRWRDLGRGGWRFYELYENWVHAAADHSFFITKEDLDWAVSHWKLDPAKCSVLTYGTDITAPPPVNEKENYRRYLREKYQLSPDMRIFIFNGTLNYLPNRDALRILIREVLPVLTTSNFSFRIIICGQQLSDQWQKELAKYPEVIYAGFVDALEMYVRGADCFINPVTLGGGIKTKLVEALAWDQRVISTESGAKGLPEVLTGNRLIRVEDYDWRSFAEQMMNLANDEGQHTPMIFYQEFNWDHIVDKARLSLPTHE